MPKDLACQFPTARRSLEKLIDNPLCQDAAAVFFWQLVLDQDVDLSKENCLLVRESFQAIRPEIKEEVEAKAYVSVVTYIAISCFLLEKGCSPEDIAGFIQDARVAWEILPVQSWLEEYSKKTAYVPESEDIEDIFKKLLFRPPQLDFVSRLRYSTLFASGYWLAVYLFQQHQVIGEDLEALKKFRIAYQLWASLLFPEWKARETEWEKLESALRFFTSSFELPEEEALDILFKLLNASKVKDWSEIKEMCEEIADLHWVVSFECANNGLHGKYEFTVWDWLRGCVAHRISPDQILQLEQKRRRDECEKHLKDFFPEWDGLPENVREKLIEAEVLWKFWKEEQGKFTGVLDSYRVAAQQLLWEIFPSLNIKGKRPSLGDMQELLKKEKLFQGRQDVLETLERLSKLRNLAHYGKGMVSREQILELRQGLLGIRCPGAFSFLIELCLKKKKEGK